MVNFFHLITSLFKYYRIKIRETRWCVRFLFNLARKKFRIYAFLTQLRNLYSFSHERHVVTNSQEKKEPISWTILPPCFPNKEENKKSPITLKVLCGVGRLHPAI